MKNKNLLNINKYIKILTEKIYFVYKLFKFN